MTHKGHTLGRMDASLAPTVRAGRDDILWAAGIFEADGHTQYSTRSEKVSVPQVGRWIPDRLRARFGGSTQPVKRRHSNWQQSYVWLITGARARGFLQSIYGLLSPRRQQQVLDVLMAGRRDA